MSEIIKCDGCRREIKDKTDSWILKKELMKFSEPLKFDFCSIQCMYKWAGKKVVEVKDGDE